LIQVFADLDISSFLYHDLKEFYHDDKEAIPPNVHKLRVKDVDLRMFVWIIQVVQGQVPSST